jgi:hypothetical protein
MSFVKARYAAALLTTLTLAAACSDPTASTIDYIDANAATSAAAPAVAVMEQPALESFGSLSAVTGLPASASAAALGAVAGITNAAARGRWDPTAPALVRAAVRAADVLPIDVRGKLYTYNETTKQYEGAASPDAPANGARIILYAWDALNNAPASPLVQIGYVDLMDESTSTEDRLHVRLVRTSDSAVLLDYTITHSVTASSESFSIAGSANNGLTTVNFNLSGTMTTSTADVTFVLEAPARNFSVRVEAKVDDTTDQATVNIFLAYDGNSLSFKLEAAPNTVSGEIRFRGHLYASYTLTYDPATNTTTEQFTKASGQPMTEQEFTEIQNALDRALDFSRFWARLLWPVATVESGV